MGKLTEQKAKEKMWKIVDILMKKGFDAFKIRKSSDSYLITLDLETEPGIASDEFKLLGQLGFVYDLDDIFLNIYFKEEEEEK